MLELVRYQEKKLQPAAGAEYEILSSSQIMESEKNRHGQLGKYMESITHSMPVQNKKSCISMHISGDCNDGEKRQKRA